MSQGITEKQRFAYFKAFGMACAELGLKGPARDEYRHHVMLEETGKGSVKELDRTNDFDKVMFRFYVDAGEPALAAGYSIGGDRRLARMVEACALQCSQILGTDMKSSTAYIAGILRQSGCTVSSPVNGTYWLDISAAHLFAVFQMLDTYRRRLIARYGLAAGSRASFNVRTVYRRDPLTGKVVAYTADGPAPYCFQIGRPE